MTQGFNARPRCSGSSPPAFSCSRSTRRSSTLRCPRSPTACTNAPLAMQPIVVAYTLTMAMLTPASGWLADRFGTRRVYFAAILVFVLGSLCCASAHTLRPTGHRARAAGRRRLDAAADRTARRAAQRARRAVCVGARVYFDCGTGRADRRADARRLVRRRPSTWHWIFLINVPIGAIGLVRGASLSCRADMHCDSAALRSCSAVGCCRCA